MRRFTFAPLAVILVLGIILLVLWLTGGPEVSLTPESGPIGGRTFTVKLQASRGGLKKLTVAAVQGEKTVNVVVKDYPAHPPEATETFNLAQAALKEGPFTLHVSGTASSLGLRKTTTRTHSFAYDPVPPAVGVLSIAHNIIRGGSALVVYTVSKEVEKTGVVFADRFVPGYRQEGGFYACLFPFPWNMAPEQYIPKVIAVDRAGNERVAGINFRLLIKPFSTDTIDLTESLLDKIASEFRNRFPGVKTPLEIFLKVNGELRKENKRALHEYGRQTSPTPLWNEVFLRMPNTAPLGGFAQTRNYVYQGKKVDEQTHLGFDLASVIHAPVPAANKGKVVYAGDFGIYGQCVVIDHGLGLQTLYSHLSRIAVKAGDNVERGQEVGNTGATGMAAGDHLHFGVTVSGEEVNPVEWWDSHWIRDNFTSKMEMAKGVATK